MASSSNSTSTTTIVALGAVLGAVGLAAAIWLLDWLIRRRRHGRGGSPWGLGHIDDAYAHRTGERRSDVESARTREAIHESTGRMQEKTVSFSMADEEGVGREELNRSRLRGSSTRAPRSRRLSPGTTRGRRTQSQDEKNSRHERSVESWTAESEHSEEERDKRFSRGRSAYPRSVSLRRGIPSTRIRKSPTTYRRRATPASYAKEWFDDNEEYTSSESETLASSTRSAPNLLFSCGQTPWTGYYPATCAQPAWYRQSMATPFPRTQYVGSGGLNWPGPYAPTWPSNTLGGFNQVENMPVQRFMGPRYFPTPNYCATASYQKSRPQMTGRIEEVEPIPVELYHSPPEASPAAADWKEHGVQMPPPAPPIARPKQRLTMRQRPPLGRRSASTSQKKKRPMAQNRSNAPSMPSPFTESADVKMDDTGAYGATGGQVATASRSSRSQNAPDGLAAPVPADIGPESDIIELPEIPTPPLALTHDRRLREWDAAGRPLLGIEVVRIGSELERVMRGGSSSGTRSRDAAERGLVAGQVASIEGVGN